MARVLIIGGGYAGVAAARSARRGGADVTMVDSGGRHELLPRLATVAGGNGPTGDAWAPLTALLPGVEVVRGRVVEVREDARVADLEDGRVLPFDSAVVTVGSSGTLPAIPGLADNALTLANAADALAVRSALAGVRSLVVVGGGPTGVQLAGEAAATHPGLEITLVEADQRLLPAFAPALGRNAERLLRKAGVEVLTGVSLRAVTPDAAELADGSRLGGLVVWAGGLVPTASVLVPGAAGFGGRLPVDGAQRVDGSAVLFAAGDAAAQRDPDGELLPASAQVAEKSGRVAGRNAARAARGLAPAAGRVRHRGWVVPVGHRGGVASLLGVRLGFRGSGWLVPLLHAVIDLKHLQAAGGWSAIGRFRPGQHRPGSLDIAAVLRSGRRAGRSARAPERPLSGMLAS